MTNNSKRLWLTIVELLFCIVFILSITYVVVTLNKPIMSLWYVAPVICYAMGDSGESGDEKDN